MNFLHVNLVLYAYVYSYSVINTAVCTNHLIPS